MVQHAMETPTIASATYGGVGSSAYSMNAGGLVNVLSAQTLEPDWNEQARRLLAAKHFQPITTTTVTVTQPQKDEEMSTLRIVRVYIADPNENLPVEKRLLYTGQEQTTDLTDQELFFEVPIQELLKTHNEVRAKTRDKEVSSKDDPVYLEPVRIRDLKMIVLTIAQF